MKTQKGFIVNSSKEGKSKDFVWFVKHKDINNGLPVPVNRGSLEHYLTAKRKLLI